MIFVNIIRFQDLFLQYNDVGVYVRYKYSSRKIYIITDI